MERHTHMQTPIYSDTHTAISRPSYDTQRLFRSSGHFWGRAEREGHAHVNIHTHTHTHTHTHKYQVLKVLESCIKVTSLKEQLYLGGRKHSTHSAVIGIPFE